MGLGPSVCKNCMTFMFREGNSWRCKCAPDETVESNLFCLTDEELAEMDRRWGTSELADRKYWRDVNFVSKVHEAFISQFWFNKDEADSYKRAEKTVDSMYGPQIKALREDVEKKRRSGAYGHHPLSDNNIETNEISNREPTML